MLSAPVKIEFVGPVVKIHGKLAGDNTYFEGGVLRYGSSGLLVRSGTGKPAGILTSFGFEPGEGKIDVPAGSNPDVVVAAGKAWVPTSVATQADVGKLFMIIDDNSVETVAGAGEWCVPCLDYKPGFALLDFGNWIIST